MSLCLLCTCFAHINVCVVGIPVGLCELWGSHTVNSKESAKQPRKESFCKGSSWPQNHCFGVVMTLFWSRFDSFEFFSIYSAYNAVFTEVYHGHAVLNIYLFQDWISWASTIYYYYFLLHKIKYNLINVTFSQYLTPATNPYATQNFDPKNYNKIVFNNQEFFRQSYFLRTVILWNNIPPNIKAAHSLQIFKHHLHSYYKAKLSTYIPP
jgi:hypothetical protein